MLEFYPLTFIIGFILIHVVDILHTRYALKKTHEWALNGKLSEGFQNVVANTLENPLCHEANPLQRFLIRKLNTFWHIVLDISMVIGVGFLIGNAETPDTAMPIHFVWGLLGFYFGMVLNMVMNSFFRFRE